MPDESILLSADLRGVRTLTLNRPQKKNAFTPALAIALEEALDQARTDDTVRVVVLTGAGEDFCSGADVSLFLAAAGGSIPEGAEEVGNVHRLLRAFPKPLIAQVRGRAVGMGVTMLPHCDLVFVSDDATFHTPFVRLGLLLEFGSSFTLPRLIGRQRANELILGARPVPAQTAAEWGLINQVFPDDALDEAVTAFATDLAAQPATAVAACKRLLLEGEEAALETAIGHEDEALRQFIGGPENVAAIEAFLASRRTRG